MREAVGRVGLDDAFPNVLHGERDAHAAHVGRVVADDQLPLVVRRVVDQQVHGRSVVGDIERVGFRKVRVGPVVADLRAHVLCQPVGTQPRQKRLAEPGRIADDAKAVLDEEELTFQRHRIPVVVLDSDHRVRGRFGVFHRRHGDVHVVGIARVGVRVGDGRRRAGEVFDPEHIHPIGQRLAVRSLREGRIVPNHAQHAADIHRLVTREYIHQHVHVARAPTAAQAKLEGQLLFRADEPAADLRLERVGIQVFEVGHGSLFVANA